MSISSLEVSIRCVLTNSDLHHLNLVQRKIFTFAELYLPKLGYAKRAHLMNAMVPGLAGGKMSASDPNSKIDFLDTAETIRKKLKSAFCEEGNAEGNGVLAFVEAVLIPISQLRLDRKSGDSILEEGLGDQRPFISDDAPPGTVFSVERDEKFGGSTHYKDFGDIKADFENKQLHPKDLKTSVANGIIRLLEPIRKAFEENEEWQKIEQLAYPDPNAKVEKKKKKVRIVTSLHECHLTSLQEKVYHPPPPGKGKNAKPVDEHEAAPPVSVGPDVAHAAAELAKQSPNTS